MNTLRNEYSKCLGQAMTYSDKIGNRRCRVYVNTNLQRTDVIQKLNESGLACLNVTRHEYNHTSWNGVKTTRNYIRIYTYR
jgi:hypothetical protein